MRVDIISIGNSKGVRIPSAVLKQCGLVDQVEMVVENGRIVLARPAPRADWEEKIARLADELNRSLCTIIVAPLTAGGKDYPTRIPIEFQASRVELPWTSFAR